MPRNIIGTQIGGTATKARCIDNRLAQCHAKTKGTPKAGATSVVMVIYAAGYHMVEDSPEKEAENAQKGFYTLRTADFLRTANNTEVNPYNQKGALTKWDFLGAITQATKKIHRVIFLGHGTKYGIGFSGIGLETNESLTTQDLVELDELIRKKIDKKLTPKAKIDLYACNMGVREEFMQVMANAFNRQIRGFSQPIAWCFKIDEKRAKVVHTGKIALKSDLPREIKNTRKTTCGERFWKNKPQQLIPTKVFKPDLKAKK